MRLRTLDRAVRRLRTLDRAVRRLRAGALAARVNLDAFLGSPGAYLQGVIWRLRGLRLRSRHRLAALKGRSPRSYALWMATCERDRLAEAMRRPQAMAATALAVAFVVDCRGGTDGLDDTLRSLAAASSAAPEVAVETVLLGPDVAAWAATGGSGLTRISGAGTTRIGGAAWAKDLPALARQLSRMPPDPSGPPPLCWVIALAAGDRLSRFALPLYRAAVADHPDARLFYADDDLIASGKRTTPHFKPGWNSELARHHDYLTESCLFACYPASIGADWPRSAHPPERAPVHVPHILHHRRRRLPPRPPASPARPASLPHVSLAIPTRDHVGLLRTCLSGIAATRYPSFDVTVIDNESREPETLEFLAGLADGGIRVRRMAGAFNFAAMHNAWAYTARGPLLCLLNNDIEITDPDWLATMVPSAMRADVGAVGARLLYSDGTIQHAGIVVGMGGGAGHAHRHEAGDGPGYFGRAGLPQFVSAVTAACLVVEKAKFDAVGGFNAEDFPVAFNDVDLCLKLNARGWQSLYEPRARLIHHESISRGRDRRGPQKQRFAGELAALKRIWHTDRRVDPFHHPELSRLCEQFVVRL